MKYSANKFFVLLSVHGKLLLEIVRTTEKFNKFFIHLCGEIKNLEELLKIYDDAYRSTYQLSILPKYKKELNNESYEDLSIMIYNLIAILNNTYYGSSYDEDGNEILMFEHISLVEYLIQHINYPLINLMKNSIVAN